MILLIKRRNRKHQVADENLNHSDSLFHHSRGPIEYWDDLLRNLADKIQIATKPPRSPQKVVTLPETNGSPLKIGRDPNRKVVLQPSICRGKPLVSGKSRLVKYYQMARYIDVLHGHFLGLFSFTPDTRSIQLQLVSGSVSNGILPKVADFKQTENQQAAQSISPTPPRGPVSSDTKGTHGMTRSDEDMYHLIFGERSTIRT